MSIASTRNLAVVTGGTRGIGLAIVELLAGRGLRVEAWGREISVPLRSVMERSEGRVTFRRVDLERDVRSGVEAIRSLQSLQCLVNNAGVGVAGRHELMASTVAERVMQVNLLAPMQLCRAAIKNFRLAQFPGAIVNMSSIVARRPYPDYAVYSASKSGLEAFSGVLAKEAAPMGVRVNCVRPGFVDTDMGRSLPNGQQAALRGRPSLPEVLRADHVASVVAWLILDSEMVTGECISVGGA